MGFPTVRGTFLKIAGPGSSIHTLVQRNLKQPVTGKSPDCGAGGASTDLGARARRSGAATKLLAASSLGASSPFSPQVEYYVRGRRHRRPSLRLVHADRVPDAKQPLHEVGGHRRRRSPLHRHLDQDRLVRHLGRHLQDEQ